jgi:hypothetical protein
MKPGGNSLISALERVHQTHYRRGVIEEKNGVYHRKAEEVYRKLVDSQLMDLAESEYVNGRFGCGIRAIQPLESQLTGFYPC